MVKSVTRVALFTIIVFAISVLTDYLVFNNELFTAILVLVCGFFSAVLPAMIVFKKGQSKPAESQPLFTFASIGIKFLSSAIIAIVYFLLFDFSTLREVILFFVLYLTFTIYLLIVVINSLKNKSINTDQV